jgi:hypothetical protein
MAHLVDKEFVERANTRTRASGRLRGIGAQPIARFSKNSAIPSGAWALPSGPTMRSDRGQRVQT